MLPSKKRSSTLRTDPDPDYTEQLAYLHSRKAAIDALIESLEDYRSGRTTRRQERPASKLNLVTIRD